MSDTSSRRGPGDSETGLQASNVPGAVEWILLTGERSTVTVGLLAAVLLVLGGLLWADVVAVENSDALTRSFVALVTGNLTLITIVISINQLILSREFGTPAELYDRVQSTVEYRQEAADLAETDVTPATPVAFLDFLVTILHEEAASLREASEGSVEEADREEIEQFSDVMISQTEAVSETLERSPEDPFESLRIVLDTDLTADLYEARRIQTLHGDSLPAAARTSLDRVIQTLEHVGVARQYLRTLYFERELAGLSRKILIVGVPTLLLQLVATWIYGAEPVPTVQGPVLGWVVVLIGTAGFAPLAVFFAYVLRIATITRRTPSLVPFEVGNDGPL